MNASTRILLEPFAIHAAWEPSVLRQDPSWVHDISAPQQKELSKALQHCRSRVDAGLRPPLVPGHALMSVEDFPLPTLGPALARAQRDLEQGLGAVLFRNFPLEADSGDVQLMYAGLVAHIGTPQHQTVDGQRLQPVQDEGQAPLDERRGSKHNLGLPVHNDGCDVVGFLCTRPAQEGGTTILVSAAAVHNAMLESHPEELQTLYQPFYNAWQDYMYEEGSNTEATKLPRTWAAPVFSVKEGQLCCRYSRFYTDRAQTYTGVPPMSEAQLTALDTFDSYLYDEQRWQYRREFERGDVLFLNNHVVLHSRTQFVDGQNAEQRRHLYRAWIAVPNSRPLAESMSCFFGNVEAGSQRGGVKKEFMLASAN
jgi:alpha-ketoglutarate-dependent taurine dioxygenase